MADNSRTVKFALEHDLDAAVRAHMEDMGIANKKDAIKSLLRIGLAALPRAGAERAAYYAAFMRARQYLFPRIGEFFSTLVEQMIQDLRDMSPGDGVGSEVDTGTEQQP